MRRLLKQHANCRSFTIPMLRHCVSTSPVNSATSALIRGSVRNGREPPYTTCLSVTTCDKMHFQYGYLEMRAMVPYGQGAWPSFWMKAMPGKISPPRFAVSPGRPVRG